MGLVEQNCSNNSGVSTSFVRKSIEAARNFFLSKQTEEGYWIFDLENDSTIVADYVYLMHYVGQVDEKRQEKAINLLLKIQQEDGGWNIYYGGPSNLDATIKCAFALQLAGYDHSFPPLAKAGEFIRRMGGLQEVHSYNRFYLSLFGQFPWEKVVAIPPELMFLPTSFYFNIYEISSWSRVILVPMSIIWALKPIKTPPANVDCTPWWSDRADKNGKNILDTFSWKTFFFTLDAILKRSNRFYAPFTRREALRRAESWMLDHISRGGGLGGVFPSMQNTIMALDALGYEADHPVMQGAMNDLLGLMVEREDDLWFQPCFSPVWDTAMVAGALERSGMEPEHPALRKSVEWLIDKEVRFKGDWQIKNPYAPAGGWAFEYENDFYPDTDDTAMVLMALKDARIPDEEKRQAAMHRGLEWLISMQSSDGGWGAFDVDNNKEIFNLIPFADHNALLDPSTADLTGRVLECLAALGHNQDFEPANRAIKFLLNQQEADGSWYGRWGVNYIYGTWQVITGLTAIGLPTEHPSIQRGVQWLLRHQLEDGGWGETCATYDDPDQKGKGPSTPSQTAWALLGLMNGGAGSHEAVTRGIRYLITTQKTDGSWDEKEFTGTGFPKVYYLRYTGYRNYFPLMALGKYATLSPA
ncbi:squalene--hopene cyclase [bacterium]|nr:squalene--hopene cyclase [bacterium]